MFIMSLMFVSYDFMNIKINFSVSYMGEIGVAPLPHPVPFNPHYPTVLLFIFKLLFILKIFLLLLII